MGSPWRLNQAVSDRLYTTVAIYHCELHTRLWVRQTGWADWQYSSRPFLFSAISYLPHSPSFESHRREYMPVKGFFTD